MRILWLHQYFATPKGWGAVRTHAFARRFVKAGHDVDVVCCAGYDASLHPTGAEPLVIDGVRVFVSGTSYRPHMGFLRRVVSFLCFMGSALWFVVWRGRRYDVVIASSGPLTLAVPALVGRWLHKTPFVFEVIDVWPDSAIAAGVLKNAVLKWLSFRLEALSYRYAAAMVTCSTGMAERVEGKLRSSKVLKCEISGEVLKCDSSKVVTISNCCDLGEFVTDEALRKSIRGRYGVQEGQTVVLYTGAMGRSNAVDDVLAAVHGTAHDDRIVWWVAGDGSRCGDIRAAVAGDGRNRFFGSMPKRELVALYLAADVNVVTFMREPLFYENSPNKFFDGIAAGLPAVFNRTTWLEPWLARYDCGIVCKGDRPGLEMAEAMMMLAGDPERRAKMGAGARRLAEEVFSRDRLAEEYLGVLGDVLTFERSKVGDAGETTANHANRANETRRSEVGDAGEATANHANRANDIWGRKVKRMLDMALILLTAVIGLPLLAITALAVLIGMGRPVFFVQERPGLGGRVFRLVKFRTMRMGAGPDHERLTRVGRVLRAASLDELPEVWNVLKGEMSLVGPRPLLMRYLERYTPQQARRHEVRPGITGWAQVNGRNAITWEQKFAYDVWYVDHRSLWLDMKILWLTVWQVVARRGISAEGEATMGEFLGSQPEARQKDDASLGE